MPVTQMSTTWSSQELFRKSVVLVAGKDSRWMIQDQSADTLTMVREPRLGPIRWLILLIYGFFVVMTLGLMLISSPLLGFLFIGRSRQRIVIITAVDDEGNTSVLINYTGGARRAVKDIGSMVTSGRS